MQIGIVDYGMGNTRSLKNAFEYLGQDVEISAHPEMLKVCDGVALPGVGAFRDAMNAIRERQLVRVLNHLALEVNKPMLGICLGMQLFARTSHEHGRYEGLGWFDAEIVPITPTGTAKVPHVGWNSVKFPSGERLGKGIPSSQSDFYFVHSFQMECADPADLVAPTDHGGPVTAIVRRGNLTATQFHPEKSQDNGLQLLQNWLDDVASC